jgi:hypothetical protein
MDPKQLDSFGEFSLSISLHDAYIVENFIRTHSGKFSKSELANHLPREMTWQYFCRVMKFLESSGKISFLNSGKVAYVFKE